MLQATESVNPLPTVCPICQKATPTVRKHLRWVHKAELVWDDEFGWTYIFTD